MGRYINPPALVAHVGERLDTYDYGRARALAGDRLLVILHQTRDWPAAAIIDSLTEWAYQLGIQQQGYSAGYAIVSDGHEVAVSESVPTRGFTIYAVDAAALQAAGGRW